MAMDSLAFNDVNQLEASYGVHIPVDSLAVAHKIFQVYGENLSVAEGVLGLLRHAASNLVKNLDSDIEEVALDWNEYYLDRAFVELTELGRDLGSQQSFYLPHVQKEYKSLEEKWNEFVKKWLPPALKSFCEIENRVGLLIQLEAMVGAFTSQQHHQIIEKITEIHTIIDQLGRTFHDDYKQNLVISPNMIIELASSSMRIPPPHMSRQLNLPPKGAGIPFFGTLIGLDHIIHFIIEAISKKNPSRCPLGSFLLLGQSGRGRTELARALAKQLFGHEDMLVICDMSHYQYAISGRRFHDDFSGDALLGRLVDISKRKAYGIIMFENIEKAFPSTFQMIVSILRDGIFKNSEGMMVDLTDVLILMKSNVGNDVFVKPCRCVDNFWKVKQILSGHQQLQIEHRNQCYYMPFIKKTSIHFSPEFLDHLDEVLVFPNPSCLKSSEIARIQLRKLITDMLSPTQKKILVYLSQAALQINLIHLIDSGGHASKEWLEKELAPEFQKSCGDGIEDLSIVYVDMLVGTLQLSCRVENSGYMLNDKVYRKFKTTLSNTRKIHYINKRHVNMIRKLGVYAHDVPYNSELMLRIITELLKESHDLKQMMENFDLFSGEEECQQQIRIERKGDQQDFMDNSLKFYYEFAELDQTTRIIKALLEPLNEFQHPRSILFLGLHHAGKQDLAVGLSKCYYVPDSPINPVIEVDLSLCTEPNSFFRCTCKGKHDELLVDAMRARARSRSIIVFYDFEIAHISVFSNILAILDHGFVSDNNGNDMDFQNSIILFVSNCGDREMISALYRGLNSDKIDNTIEELVLFRTEFLNRVDEIVLFHPFRCRQFDPVLRLLVRSGLPKAKRQDLSTFIHSLFYSGETMHGSRKMNAASALRSLITRIKAV